MTAPSNDNRGPTISRSSILSYLARHPGDAVAMVVIVGLAFGLMACVAGVAP